MSAGASPAVLLIHNRYRQTGGEERCVAQLTRLLRDRGHRVELLERSSGSLEGLAGRARAGTAMLSGGTDPDAVGTAVREAGAQVVHAHNINPLFGARSLVAAREAGARVVMHLHNYRLFCAIGIAFREGRPCHLCRGRNTAPGVRHRCRGRLGEAAVYGAALAMHQRRVVESVDRFAVPSRAAAGCLAELGLPAERTEVVRGPLAAEEFAGSPSGAGKYALVAGRLTEEKGFDVAIVAAARAGVPLVVAGTGPDEGRLRRLAGEHRSAVEFKGALAHAELVELRRDAAFALAPSRWEEVGPYAVSEAMAAGLPVLASGIGGLPEMVGEEATVSPADDLDAWAGAIRALWEDEALRAERAAVALARARELFAPEPVYRELMRVYAEAGAVAQ